MNEPSPPPAALVAMEVPPRTKPSIYPPIYAARVQGRINRQLGEPFGLRNFGVNLTIVEPGSISALHHAHSLQDEFIYVLEGELVLFSGDTRTVLSAGMCAGFPAGGAAHHLENRGSAPAAYLEIGDRTSADVVTYPDDDLLLTSRGDQWVVTRKDGTPY
jgi:uncharacterized cupin superfamily protein